MICISRRDARRECDGNWRAGLGFVAISNPMDFAVLTVTFAAGVVAWIQLLLPVLPAIADKAFPSPTSTSWITNAGALLAVVVGAPLAEELFFRGWLWTALRRLLGAGAGRDRNSIPVAVAPSHRRMAQAAFHPSRSRGVERGATLLWERPSLAVTPCALERRDTRTPCVALGIGDAGRGPAAHSSRSGRDSSAAMAAATSSRPVTSPATAAQTGIATPAASRGPAARARSRRPRSHAVRSARMSASERPRAERHAERDVAAGRAGAGQQQVAQAGQARDGLRPPAQGGGQPADLGQAARDQGGARVLAQPGADHHAGGDGDHVLRRAADLRADRVVVAVEPEAGRRQRVDRRLRARRPRLPRPRPRPACPRPPRAAKLGPVSTPAGGADAGRRGSRAAARACRPRRPWRSTGSRRDRAARPRPPADAASAPRAAPAPRPAARP